MDRKWKRMPAAYGGNGRIRPGYAQIGEEQVKFDQPSYDLRMYEGRTPTYKAVGKNASDADAERHAVEQTASRTEVEELATAAGLKVVDAPERKRLSALFSEYSQNAEEPKAQRLPQL